MLCFQGTGAVVAWRHVVVFVPERDVVRVAFFVLLPRQRTGVARGIEGISAKCREPSCRGQWEEGFNMCSSVVRVCSHHAFAGGTESLLCFEGTGAVVAWRHVRMMRADPDKHRKASRRTLASSHHPNGRMMIAKGSHSRRAHIEPFLPLTTA